jgi:hypothetical protein
MHWSMIHHWFMVNGLIVSKWVKVDDVHYKINDYFVANSPGGKEIPVWIEIKCIIRLENDRWFAVHCYHRLSFRKNWGCYAISPSNLHTVLLGNEFLTSKAAGCNLIDNSRFIRVPYRLIPIESIFFISLCHLFHAWVNHWIFDNSSSLRRNVPFFLLQICSSWNGVMPM